MKKELFAVIVFQSFDPDTPAYLFDNEMSANEYAKELWLESFATEAKESVRGIDPERSYWDDDANEGEIYWGWGDPDYIRIFVTQMTDYRRENDT